MLFDSHKDLSNSSILKWLVSSAIITFFMMGLLMFLLYERSVSLYNDNLDQWLISESQRLEHDAQNKYLSLPNVSQGKRYLYHFNAEIALKTIKIIRLFLS